MTALVTLEAVSLRDAFTAADYNPNPAESRINLRSGERMKVRALIRALLLESANDAAVTLAEGVSGSRGGFVRDMNRRARQLGLKHTSYANPIGLDDPDNYSSARDLAMLTERLLRNRFFARTVNLPDVTLRSGSRRRTIDNRNELVGQVGWVSGVKTGHTNQAGYNLVGSATRSGVKVVSVVLGEPSEAARNADTLALLRYGLGRYRRATLLRGQEVLGEAKVKHREEDTVELVAARDVRRVIRRGEKPLVRIRAEDVLEGPLPRGARAGTAVVRVDDEVVARVPVITAQPVPQVSFLERAWRVVSRPEVALLVLTALLAGSLLVVMLRRRRVRTA
jgi:serine-type D-Ala-D-Ala carboxypeptidase (penicillin-binding protein 5/6)